MKRLLRVAGIAAAAAIAAAALYVANVALGMRAHARIAGTISGLALRAPVTILRDDRDVPHVIAADEHDLFFAQGYAEGSDRLFQMDLLRRYVEGTLAEVLGQAALASDERQRAVPVRAIVDGQWRSLDVRTREIFGAFSDGVNAAIEREPLPVEFRILAYRPQPWTPKDSLAVSMATVLDLIDDWNEVASRDRAYRAGGTRLLDARFPLTDPCYDAPLADGLAGIGPGAACTRRAALLPELGDRRPPVGSNEWAAGASRTTTGRSLLANDPHLGLSIPGAWYLVDLRAPGFHAAGATFPGSPGVVLGHDDRVAWAATDGTVASLSLFAPPAHLDPRGWQTETFRVRLHIGSITKRYYRTPRDFGLTTNGGRFVLVRWSAYEHPISPAPTFLVLDQARSLRDAIAAVAAFPGPTQNFALAGVDGSAAYRLGGTIPDDPAWARWIHPAGDLTRTYSPVPLAQMPFVAPSRNALVWTANNKMYGRAYPLRLSASFAPPYRAYRIAELLRERSKYGVADFARMQMDVLSLPERDLAHALAASIRRHDATAASALATWDGEMRPDSVAATLAEGLRLALTQQHAARMPALLAATRAFGSIPGARIDPADLASPKPWRIAGAIPVRHALAALGITFLDGSTFAGDGDAFTLHMQSLGPGGADSQSFRAVWDVGNWDAGGITLPQGESGEPGSGHYLDQAPAWIAGRLLPLPYSAAAVERAAVQREELRP